MNVHLASFVHLTLLIGSDKLINCCALMLSMTIIKVNKRQEYDVKGYLLRIISSPLSALPTSVSLFLS